MPKTVLESAQQLRQLAEEKYSNEGSSATDENRSPEEIAQLLHELRVHQIELEMQNEELRRTQHELEEAKARYFDLYDLAPIGYLTLNEQGVIQEANLTAATMLGVTRQKLIHRPLTRFILPEDQNVYYFHRNKSVDAGDLRTCELRLLRPDGALLWVHLQDSCGETGDYRVTLSKITKRKRAENDLAINQRLLSDITDNSSSLIYALDSDGKFLLINRTLEKLFGISRETLIGKSREAFMTPEVAESHRANDLQVIATRQPITFEEKNIEQSGTHTYLSCKFPLTDQHGTIYGTAGISTDITARKRSEIELARKNGEIEQFTYTVSHDLRGPMVTVRTFLGYLETDLAAANAERISEDLSFIKDAADKMDLLLGELNEISRIGHVNNKPVTVTFQQLAAEVRASLAYLIEPLKANITVGAANPTLFGDHLRFSQIWRHLLENALKFMGNQTSPRIELGCEERSDGVFFFVRDNGIGIEPENFEKIFVLFKKLDKTTPGTGLGLAMAKRIVELYGGVMSVESDGLGQGTCFWFTLPGAINQSK